MFSVTKATGNKYPPPFHREHVCQKPCFSSRSHTSIYYVWWAKSETKREPRGTSTWKCPRSHLVSLTLQRVEAGGVCVSPHSALVLLPATDCRGTELTCGLTGSPLTGRPSALSAGHPALLTRARPRCIRAEAFNQVIFIFNKEKGEGGGEGRESIPSDVSVEGRCR